MIKSIGEIRDPIHGYIFMTSIEKEIIDSKPLQRLRRIKQLSGAFLTYPGAEHSRFSHSLGVMHLAGLLGNHFTKLSYIDEEDVQKIRIAGLLHDIGHGPFSHMYEEILGKYRNMTHEDVTQWLIKNSELKDILTKYGYSTQDLSKLAVGKLEKPDKRFLNQIIASQFNADTMDYLLRDSYFAGVEYGKIDVHRLINSIDVFDNTLAMNIDALYALESFVIARYEMFKAVYFHRTVRAAEIMLVRAMDYANDQLELTSFQKPKDYLKLEDANVLSRLLSLKPLRTKKIRISQELAELYLNRKLLKCVHTTIIHHQNDFYTNLMSRDEIRNQIIEEIGEKSGVDPYYILIDVPTVPSVPYYPLLGKPSEIPVFQSLPDGSKERRTLSEYSPIIDALVGYMDIIRIYTTPKFRNKVRDGVAEIFGKQPFSTKISM